VHWLFEPGLFTSAPVRTALAVGTVAAVVSAVVGVFTILRGLAFAGHALTDVAATGGSGAVLVGASPLSGFLSGALIGAGAIAVSEGPESHHREIATGVVLSAATGLSALLLYLDATTTATTGVTQRVLFGSLFSTSASTVPLTVVLGTAVLVLTAVIARPLLLTSLSRELARARGIRVTLVSSAFLLIVAMAVGLSALTVGSLLSTALLVGPAAAAVRWTARIGRALLLASAIGVLSTWLGVVIAYDSYNWMPHQRSLPVGFSVVVVIVTVYLLSAMRTSGPRGDHRG